MIKFVEYNKLNTYLQYHLLPVLKEENVSLLLEVGFVKEFYVAFQQ
jgi:hypothetical protein